MAGSEFWRDLGERFVQLQHSGTLRQNDSNAYFYSTLQTLINRGRSAITAADVTSSPPFWFWLEELKKAGLVLHVPSKAAMTESDPAWQIEADTLAGICEASATLCARLEDRALQEEFREMQSPWVEESAQTSPSRETMGKGMRRSLYEPALCEKMMRKKRQQLEEIRSDLDRLPLDHSSRPRLLERMLYLQNGIPELEREYSRRRASVGPEMRERELAATEAPERHQGARGIDDNASLESIIHKVQNPQKFRTLPVKEAASYFSVTTRTIHRWIAKRKLKSDPGRGMITIESINTLKQKGSRKPRRKPEKWQ